MRAIVVGGSSGMGKAAAKVIVDSGGEVVICSRSADKLAAAAAHISGDDASAASRVLTQQLDNTDEVAVRAFFESLEPGYYDTLIVTALGRAVHGPFLSLDVGQVLQCTDRVRPAIRYGVPGDGVWMLRAAQVRDVFEGKLWGPWYCTKYGAPKLADGGSIVFVSGVLNRRPGVNCSPLGAANGVLLIMAVGGSWWGRGC